MVRAGQVDKMEMRFWWQGGRRRSLVAKSGPDARRDHRGEARGDAMAGMKSMVVIEIVMWQISPPLSERHGKSHDGGCAHASETQR